MGGEEAAELEVWEPWVMAVFKLEAMQRQAATPPRPLVKRVPLVGSGPDPVGRSIAGFEAAVSAVLQLDHLAAVRDWDSWRPRVATIAATVSSIGEASVAHRPDIQAEIDALRVEEHRAYRRSNHVGTVISSASRRIYEVASRRREREREITAAIHPASLASSASLDDISSASKAFLGQRAVITETAVAQVNSQIRRVLDLTDETQRMSVVEWLSMCESQSHEMEGES
ncbi:hypothetical protein [Mycolicibacterium farcinogenes]|uniref:Uncharacterized protein n=1 Tax=Mycolicibacterium farcinogenes TaxID=1802 RepID=A0ACD1FRB6_MYCFR|nr:hypothetical protein [Mycolicibacterium farcinogenes]QZH69599.1 hypothetical protein K6L26_31550 [Mycolicibacterium farcinogenes]